MGLQGLGALAGGLATGVGQGVNIAGQVQQMGVVADERQAKQKKAQQQAELDAWAKDAIATGMPREMFAKEMAGRLTGMGDHQAALEWNDAAVKAEAVQGARISMKGLVASRNGDIDGAVSSFNEWAKLTGDPRKAQRGSAGGVQIAADGQEAFELPPDKWTNFAQEFYGSALEGFGNFVQLDPNIRNTEAKTGNIQANTDETRALMPGKVALQGAQTRNIDAETNRSETLLPYDVQDTEAGTALKRAGTADTYSGMREREALLPGRIESQDADIDATRAGAADTRAGTFERRALLPGRIEGQGAEIAATRAGTADTKAVTRERQALLPLKQEGMASDIDATRAQTETEDATRDPRIAGMLADTEGRRASTATENALRDPRVAGMQADTARQRQATYRDQKELPIDLAGKRTQNRQGRLEADRYEEQTPLTTSALSADIAASRANTGGVREERRRQEELRPVALSQAKANVKQTRAQADYYAQGGRSGAGRQGAGGKVTPLQQGVTQEVDDALTQLSGAGDELLGLEADPNPRYPQLQDKTNRMAAGTLARGIAGYDKSISGQQAAMIAAGVVGEELPVYPTDDPNTAAIEVGDQVVYVPMNTLQAILALKGQQGAMGSGGGGAPE